MSYIAKVTEKVEGSNCVDMLIRSLYQAVGNKVFMRGVEKVFKEKLQDLSGQDAEDLCHLARALKNADNNSSTRRW